MTATRAVTPAKPVPSAEAYLSGATIVNSAIQALLFLTAAGLAMSRAEGNVVSAGAVVGIVAVSAASSTALAWVSGLYGAASDARLGKVTVDTTSGRADPLEARRLWRDAGLWAIGAAVWAAAGGGLVAVALDGRVAKFPVLLASLVGLAGVATIAVGGAARRRGLATSHAVAAKPTPLRTRAWKEIALPVALLQGFVNAGVAWVLFHDYATPSDPGPKPSRTASLWPTP